MNEIAYVTGLIGCTVSEFEELMIRNYIQWCTDKCYAPVKNEKVQGITALHLKLNTQDLQSLIADRALFNYFRNLYIDAILDFKEDTEGMNPKPNTNEARHIFNNCVLSIYRFFNIDLMTAARNKKIVEYVKN